MNRSSSVHETWHPRTKEDRDAVRRELEMVLTSPHFCNSKRYPAFLRHIVENTLESRSEMLKERNLGVEVFDRPPTYDTNTDTVVRYTAGEVRKRLLLYYSDEGRNSKIHILLPSGSYVPEFSRPDQSVGTTTEDDIRPATRTALGTSSALEGEQQQNDLRQGNEILPLVANAPSLRSRSGSIRRRWLWGVLAGVLSIAAALTALRLTPRAQDSATTAIDEFWAPLLDDQHSVLICAGSVVFAQDNYSGVATAGGNTDYPFFSMQTVSAITSITSVLLKSGVSTQLLSAPSTPLTNLREHSVVLLGAYNNQWTMRLLDSLRFHFYPNPRERIVDSKQPQLGWERDESQPYSSTDDYAVIARFRDPRIDGWVVVLAGIGRNGTEAAAQFVTSPHYLELLRQRIGSGFGNRNFEAVLKVNVIKGETGAPSILAAYAW
jgi:hypothetical protein